MLLSLRAWANGRCGRLQYWLLAVMTWLFYAGSLRGLMLGLHLPAGVGIAVLQVTLLIPFAIIQVPRWHDMGRSAWNALWGLVPGIGILIAIPLGLIRGTRGPNQYGAENRAL
jgi:uncharacterized membrane protein YhaH (DUF805 family)